MPIKLSIIIPIYKEEEYIEECLSSLLDEINNSKLPNKEYEVIVVSDGASDEAENKILKYKELFDNFKFLKMQHKGAGTARNQGISLANGEYVSFLDADDRISKGFLIKCNELLNKNKDLYIFGLKRIEDGRVEYWTVKDKEYENIYEFADEYIKNGHLLIYSNCNKLYKTKIIRDNNIKFDEQIHFGEDRLFNYDYLYHCDNIVTSSIIKHDYIKRSETSQSTKHYEKYFDIILKLHIEKVKCFLKLSKNVSDAEISSFASGDLIEEIENTFKRFDLHKEEEEENIKIINDLVFEKPDDMSDDIGIFIILGSSNCGYKVKKALELCRDKINMKYIVSGGNLHISKDKTEAEYMASMLEESGVSKVNIYIENMARNTKENFQYSYKIIQNILKEKDMRPYDKIGILTSGFHLKRAKLLANRFFSDFINKSLFFSAFGPIVSLRNWYKSENGKNIVYNEIRKNVNNDFNVFRKKYMSDDDKH